MEPTGPAEVAGPMTGSAKSGIRFADGPIPPQLRSRGHLFPRSRADRTSSAILHHVAPCGWRFRIARHKRLFSVRLKRSRHSEEPDRATKQSRTRGRSAGLLRFARNDGTVAAALLGTHHSE